MPRKRLIAGMQSLRWTWFELALLRYLRKETTRTIVDHIRSALRYYARRSPAFTPEARSNFVRSMGPARLTACPKIGIELRAGPPEI